MSLWLQHLLVLLAVALCAAYAVWQIVRTLRGQRSRAGACCSKGCATEGTPKSLPARREVFLPVDLLRRK